MAEAVPSRFNASTQLQRTAQAPGVWSAELAVGIDHELLFSSFIDYAVQYPGVPFSGFVDAHATNVSVCTLYRDLSPNRPNPMPQEFEEATAALCRKFDFGRNPLEATGGCRSIFRVLDLPLEEAAARAEAHLPPETGISIVQALLMGVRDFGRRGQVEASQRPGLVISGPNDDFDITRRVASRLGATHIVEEDGVAGETRKIKIHRY